MILDRPLTRQGCICPLCECSKDAGLLTCWPCYRLWGLRYGAAPDVERVIDAFERGLQVRQRMHYFATGTVRP